MSDARTTCHVLLPMPVCRPSRGCSATQVRWNASCSPRAGRCNDDYAKCPRGRLDARKKSMKTCLMCARRTRERCFRRGNKLCFVVAPMATSYRRSRRAAGSACHQANRRIDCAVPWHGAWDSLFEHVSRCLTSKAVQSDAEFACRLSP